MEVRFVNDNNVKILLSDIPGFYRAFSKKFRTRPNQELFFRKISTYLINNKLIDGNIIDLGAWIGDNSIPWAMNLNHTVYAIDPAPQNIMYIKQMAQDNGVQNIKTIAKAIGDKNELIGTEDILNHCSFRKGEGRITVESTHLDYLHSQGEIDNIAYIHLDVEGFEFNVIKGSEQIIELFKPIISYEQHLETCDYKGLSLHLYNKGYNIYLINEILPGCREDCRNLLAFPNDKGIPVGGINHSIGKNVLLSVLNWNNIPYSSLFTATLYGSSISKQFRNVRSVEYDGMHIFCINDNNYTKIVVVDRNKNWVCSKRVQGEINIVCKQSIINAYLTAQGEETQENYNIKDINRIS